MDIHEFRSPPSAQTNGAASHRKNGKRVGTEPGLGLTGSPPVEIAHSPEESARWILGPLTLPGTALQRPTCIAKPAMQEAPVNLFRLALDRLARCTNPPLTWLTYSAAMRGKSVDKGCLVWWRMKVCASVMGRHLVARIARRRAAFGQLLAQLVEFTGSAPIDVQLLAEDGHVQLIQQILA